MAKVTVKLVKSQDFEPMTKGIHNFTILEADVKKSKTGNFDNIFWTFECMSSEAQENVGKKIPNYCTTCKPDCTWALSDLRKACGFEVVEGEELDFDTDEMIGASFSAVTDIEEYVKKKDDGTEETRYKTVISKFIFAE